jgi:hypothetical protein
MFEAIRRLVEEDLVAFRVVVDVVLPRDDVGDVVVVGLPKRSQGPDDGRISENFVRELDVIVVTGCEAEKGEE